jgi:hypothetical protein
MERSASRLLLVCHRLFLAAGARLPSAAWLPGCSSAAPAPDAPLD